MTGFEDFVAELVRNEAQVADEHCHEPTPARQSDRLVAQVLHEVANASVLIAVTTAIANAAESGAANPGQSGIAIFAPMQPAYFPTMVGALLGSDADLAICRVVQAYCARLALAQRLITAFAAAPDQAPAQSSVDPEILAYAWRRTCRTAIDCIEALAKDQARTVPDQLKPYVQVLQLLRRAEDGHSPCLEPDGRITIPGWAERRHEVRQSLQLAAMAQFGERTAPVMIRDASVTGLGIECAHPALPGDRITVRLPCDRTLLGEVTWADGRRIGIRLKQRLTARDPLLGG